MLPLTWLSPHSPRGEQGDLMIGERVAPQSEVIRAILSEDGHNAVGAGVAVDLVVPVPVDVSARPLARRQGAGRVVQPYVLRGPPPPC